MDIDEITLAINELTDERNRVRNKEDELTSQLKILRKKLSDANRSNAKKSNVSGDEYKKLKNENFRLRKMLAISGKADGKTFAEIGHDIAGVSAERARYLYCRALRDLRISHIGLRLEE